MVGHEHPGGGPGWTARNAGKTAPAKAVVFLVLDKGQPVAVPAE